MYLSVFHSTLDVWQGSKYVITIYIVFFQNLVSKSNKARNTKLTSLSELFDVSKFILLCLTSDVSKSFSFRFLIKFSNKIHSVWWVSNVSKWLKVKWLELSGCGFESCCIHLSFRNRICSEHRVWTFRCLSKKS